MRILVIEPFHSENLDRLIDFCRTYFSECSATVLVKSGSRKLPDGFETVVFDPRIDLRKRSGNGIVHKLKQRNFSHCLVSFSHRFPAHQFYTRIVPVLLGIPTVILIDGDT